MRWLILLTLVSCSLACVEHGSTPDGATPPELPAACVGHCTVTDPEVGTDVCCDSVTCVLDTATNTWSVVFCDPPPDPCAACSPDQLCVQAFDGSCTVGTRCVDRVVDCPDNACTPACEAAYCLAPSQCQNRLRCGTESALAFTCYGP